MSGYFNDLISISGINDCLQKKPKESGNVKRKPSRQEMLSRIMVDRKTHQHICYECNQTFESEGLLPTTIECAWCMKNTNTKDSLIRYAMKYVKKDPSLIPSCIFCGQKVERGYFLSHMTFCSYIELHFETTIDQTEKIRENVLSDTFEGNLINNTLKRNTMNENDKIDKNIVNKTEKENLLDEKQNDKTEEGFVFGKTEKLKEKVNIDFEENEDLKEKFYCEKCEFVCLSKDWLDVHTGITHDTAILFEDNKLKPKELLQSRECNICQKFFRSKRRLSRHTETIHNKEKENEPGNRSEDGSFSIKVRNYGCTKCDKKFKYYNSSIRHDKNCGKLLECNLICDHCGKGFDTEYGMNRHVKNHVENEHNGKKEELCDECGKCFLTSKK